MSKTNKKNTTRTESAYQQQTAAPSMPSQSDGAQDTPVVEITGLCKKYSKKADYAVRDVTFS